MLTKISQTEKTKCWMISYTCQIKKKKKKTKTETEKNSDTGNKLVITRGERGWKGEWNRWRAFPICEVLKIVLLSGFLYILLKNDISFLFWLNITFCWKFGLYGTSSEKASMVIKSMLLLCPPILQYAHFYDNTLPFF